MHAAQQCVAAALTRGAAPARRALGLASAVMLPVAGAAIGVVQIGRRVAVRAALLG